MQPYLSLQWTRWYPIRATIKKLNDTRYCTWNENGVMMKHSRFNWWGKRNAMPIVFDIFAALLNKMRPRWYGPGVWQTWQKARSHRGGLNYRIFWLEGPCTGSGARSNCVALSCLCGVFADCSAQRIVRLVRLIFFVYLHRMKRYGSSQQWSLLLTGSLYIKLQKQKLIIACPVRQNSTSLISFDR